MRHIARSLPEKGPPPLFFRLYKKVFILFLKLIEEKEIVIPLEKKGL